jgi:uncharacterized protein (TIGR00251 family)
LELRLKVVPGASRDQIAGILGDRLKIRTATAPEGGKANKAVAALLANWLNVPVRQIELVGGPTNPEKTFKVHGIKDFPV